MSRSRKLIQRHPIRWTAGIIIMAAALVMLSGFVYNTVSNHNTANRIAKAYDNSNAMPKMLQLQHKAFSGTPFWLLNSPGKWIGWTYTYRPSAQQTIRETNRAVRASLQDAGFTIAEFVNGEAPDAEGNVGNIDANNKQLSLSVLIAAVANSNDPNAITENVGVTVDEQ